MSDFGEECEIAIFFWIEAIFEALQIHFSCHTVFFDSMCILKVLLII